MSLWVSTQRTQLIMNCKLNYSLVEGDDGYAVNPQQQAEQDVVRAAPQAVQLRQLVVRDRSLQTRQRRAATETHRDTQIWI